MRRIFLTQLAALLLLLPLFSVFSINPAEAACASNGRCYGAVGVGPRGAWGNAYNYPSSRSAIRAVQRNCKGNCTTIKSFYNTCGAIAQGDNGGWGWAWHGNQNEARSQAIAYCVPNDRNCRIRSWACTSR